MTNASNVASDSYGPWFAVLYDVFYGNKPYEAEAAFLSGLFQEVTGDRPHGSNLLDVACGTGEHAFAFERLGYRVEGVDLSDAMIDQARRKAEGRGSTVTFRAGDMRAIETAQSFDLVTCLFDSIGYAVTDQGVLDVLRGVHRCLRPGGLFATEFWHATAMLHGYEPVRLRRFPYGDGEIFRISETDVDLNDHTAHVRFTAFIPEGTHYVRLEEDHVNRFFYPAEIDDWLRATGFDVVESFGGFTRERVENGSFHVVTIARRP